MEVSPQVAEAEEDVTDLKVLRTGTTPFAKMDYQAWMGISSGFKGGIYVHSYLLCELGLPCQRSPSFVVCCFEKFESPC